MPVPEAPIHEDRCAVLRKDDVRPSWKIPAVEPEAISARMKTAADEHFRLGVLAPDAGHHFAAFGLRDNVSHSFQPVGACQLH